MFYKNFFAEFELADENRSAVENPVDDPKIRKEFENLASECRNFWHSFQEAIRLLNERDLFIAQLQKKFEENSKEIQKLQENLETKTKFGKIFKKFEINF